MSSYLELLGLHSREDVASFVLGIIAGVLLLIYFIKLTGEQD